MHRPFRSSVLPGKNYARFPELHTFREASESFVKYGGNALYLPKVVAHLGDWHVTSICPFDIYEMAKALYPSHKNTTLNRQALAPARAVLIHAYERGWCNRIHLRRLKEARPKKKSPASAAWLHAFVRQCQKDGHTKLAALVLFMSSTGARVSEPVNLRWRDVDLAKRSIVLRKTKTDTDSRRGLTDEVTARLTALRGTADLNERVFSYSCRQAVNSRIAALCARRHKLQVEPCLRAAHIRNDGHRYGYRYSNHDGCRGMAQLRSLSGDLRARARERPEDRRRHTRSLPV